MDISREYWSWRQIKILDDYVTRELQPEAMETIFRIPFGSAHEFVLLSVDRYIYFGHRVVWWGDEVKMWSTDEIQLTLIVRPLDELCVVVFFFCNIEFGWIWITGHQLCEKIEKRSKCRDVVLQFIAFALSPRAMLKFSSSYKSLTFYVRSAADFTKRLKTGGRKNARLWNSMIWESFFLTSWNS